MRKGIATIIATIILVVITIGLISTAYIYFASIVTVGPVVSSMTVPRCSFETDRYEVTIYLKNEGTEKWNSIDWLLDGGDLPAGISFTTTTCESVEAGKTEHCVFENTTATTDLSGTHTIIAIGPRNQVSIPFTC